MPNPDYNSQVGNGYSKKGGAKPPTPQRGGMGAEHDAAHKDSTVTWPGAPGATRPNFNKTGAPVIKTTVVADGVLSGGQDHFTK